MTFDRDPPRWTASPELAPEELRGPLSAAAGEGPSALQMKSLALKLAAISAGTVAAAGAATAKAAATTAGGASAKAAGALTLGKTLASLAIVGAVGTSAVLWQRSQETRAPRTQPTEQRTLQGPAPAAPTVSSPEQPAARAPGLAPRVEPLTEPTGEAGPGRATPVSSEQPSARASESAREPTTRKPARAVRAAASSAQRPRVSSQRDEPKQAADSQTVRAHADVPSEVELLRRARAALASRPRAAYALTEEHREHYPNGVFVQERDALAIEALLRAGDEDAARDLARRFIRDYPASPHAHRFRETMGL